MPATRCCLSRALQHRYSIWGWVLVSAAVQGAAGEPFGRFMVRQVFEPLAMERTVVAETEGLDGVTLFYGPSFMLRSRLGVNETSQLDYSCLAGAGAFLSTPTDLVRLGSAMLKPGLLKAETIAALQTPTRLASGASSTYALGWTVSSVQLAGKPARMVSHRGSPMGGSVSLLTFPELGLAVAAAANVSHAAGVDPFALTGRRGVHQMKRACFCFLSSVLMVATALAQTPERLPSFEVASVKKNTSGDSRAPMRTQPGGRFVATNVLLKFLIADGVRDGRPAIVDRRPHSRRAGLDRFRTLRHQREGEHGISNRPPTVRPENCS